MAMNVFGETTYETWAGWKKGLKTRFGRAYETGMSIFIDGDIEIATALLIDGPVGTKPIHTKEGRNVIGLGEWDGYSGYVRSIDSVEEDIITVFGY